MCGRGPRWSAIDDRPVRGSRSDGVRATSPDPDICGRPASKPRRSPEGRGGDRCGAGPRGAGHGRPRPDDPRPPRSSRHRRRRVTQWRKDRACRVSPRARSRAASRRGGDPGRLPGRALTGRSATRTAARSVIGRLSGVTDIPWIGPVGQQGGLTAWLLWLGIHLAYLRIRWPRPLGVDVHTHTPVRDSSPAARCCRGPVSGAPRPSEARDNCRAADAVDHSAAFRPDLGPLVVGCDARPAEPEAKREFDRVGQCKGEPTSWTTRLTHTKLGSMLAPARQGPGWRGITNSTQQHVRPSTRQTSRRRAAPARPDLKHAGAAHGASCWLRSAGRDSGPHSVPLIHDDSLGLVSWVSMVPSQIKPNTIPFSLARHEFFPLEFQRAGSTEMHSGAPMLGGNCLSLDCQSILFWFGRMGDPLRSDRRSRPLTTTIARPRLQTSTRSRDVVG